MNRGRAVIGGVLAVLVVAALAFVVLRGPGGVPGAGRELTLEERLAQDDRLVPVLAPCPFGKQFTADTSDMTAVLVDKLEVGERDPLRQAKEELAALGAAAVPDLERLLVEVYTDKWRHGVAENILAVCALMDGDWGLSLLRYGAQHPQETVRLTALDGLRKHGTPEDYELVESLLGFASSGHTRAEVAVSLHALDPERLDRDFVTWVERQEWSDVWHQVAPVAVAPTDPDTVARYRAIADGLVPNLEPFFLAAPARDGDESALAELREMLVNRKLGAIQSVMDALAGVGLGSEVRVVLESDSRDALRAQAASIIAEMPPSQETYELLTAGLADPSDGVREVCLLSLVERGDQRAVAECFELLQGSIKERDVGMRALRRGWEANPGSAQKAYDLLVRLFEERVDGAQSVRVSLLQALSQVPGRRTAEYLLDVGRRATGEIRGLRPFRWCAMQCYNAGPEAVQYLREQLAVETDPFRRLDLLFAISIEHSAETRTLLREVITNPDVSSYELAYAASLLVELGPASEVAPLLKRTYLSTTDSVARPALHCLLWSWYG